MKQVKKTFDDTQKLTSKPNHSRDYATPDDIIRVGREIKPYFEWALNIAVSKFAEKTGHNVLLKTTDLKSLRRIKEKLKEVDVNGDLRKIRDVVRASVVFKNVEQMLDFINFTQNLSIEKSEFYNFKTSDRVRNSDLIKYFGNKIIMPTDYDKKVGRKPIRMNIFTSNGFNFQELPFKYLKDMPFLEQEVETPATNYMDMKFYVEVPMAKGDSFICEVIANIQGYDNLYGATHKVLEITRTEKKLKSDPLKFGRARLDDDISCEALLDGLKYYVYKLHTKMLENYNEQAVQDGRICIYPGDGFDPEKKTIINNWDIENSLSLLIALEGDRNSVLLPDMFNRLKNSDTVFADSMLTRMMDPGYPIMKLIQGNNR